MNKINMLRLWYGYCCINSSTGAYPPETGYKVALTQSDNYPIEGKGNMSKEQVKIDAKVDYSEIVSKLMDCTRAADAMTILSGKKVPEIKTIMLMVKSAKDKAAMEMKAIAEVKAEVEGLLHETYGRPELLPRPEVVSNKTRLAVWIFAQKPALSKAEFVAEFQRIASALKLSFADDKSARERYTACYSLLRRDPALAEKYGKTYKALFSL